MTYIVRIRKGGYDYLYECRSRRPEGGGNPVSDRIYIGRVDVETRRFIPKRYHVNETFLFEECEIPGGVRELPRIPRCYMPMRECLSAE